MSSVSLRETKTKSQRNFELNPWHGRYQKSQNPKQAIKKKLMNGIKLGENPQFYLSQRRSTSKASCLIPQFSWLSSIRCGAPQGPGRCQENLGRLVRKDHVDLSLASWQPNLEFSLHSMVQKSRCWNHQHAQLEIA